MISLRRFLSQSAFEVAVTPFEGSTCSREGQGRGRGRRGRRGHRGRRGLLLMLLLLLLVKLLLMLKLL